jgi:hypothetical protein
MVELLQRYGYRPLPCPVCRVPKPGLIVIGCPLLFEVTMNYAVLPFEAAMYSVFVETERVAAPAARVT